MIDLQTCISVEKIQQKSYSNILKPNMGVYQDGSAQGGVHDRVQGTSSKWSYCQRDESNGNQSKRVVNVWIEK